MMCRSDTLARDLLPHSDPLDIDEQIAPTRRLLAETAKAQAETNPLNTRTFPAWAFIIGIVLAVALASPVMIAMLDRVWPLEASEQEPAPAGQRGRQAPMPEKSRSSPAAERPSAASTPLRASLTKAT